MTQALATLLRHYVAIYPLVMALVWSGLALVYYWRRERRERWLLQAPRRPLAMPVSILIPCFNEASLLATTLQAALSVDWPEFEVIAINDGSSDDTGRQLNQWATENSRLRVVHLVSNQGKALALRAGALIAKHEWLVCIDADALLDRHALGWLMRHFPGRDRLAAVTGNPRIRNRSSLMGRIQVGEFSLFIGLIKRAQALGGSLFCVSGVIGAFRRSALHGVGYWDSDCLTEDIAITWRLQRAGWQVEYEPHALIWILMPETLAGLWRQRRRWAEGGLQVIISNLDLLVRPQQWHLLPLLVEPLASLLWAYALVACLLLGLPPAGGLALLPVVCLGQFMVSFQLDRPYDRGLAGIGFWMVWYPLVFWLVTLVASLVALPRVLLRQQPQRARWVSPDRGRLG